MKNLILALTLSITSMLSTLALFSLDQSRGPVALVEAQLLLAKAGGK